MPIERFEQLEVWQWAHRLVLNVYKTTQGLPRDQRFGLITQRSLVQIQPPQPNGSRGLKP